MKRGGRPRHRRNHPHSKIFSDLLDDARGVMLDTVYHEFGTGYVPRWHRDIIDLHGAYLASARHTLLIAERDGVVVATGALDSRGPVHPPNPQALAERYPSGTTAQLRRIYVRPEHRRRGLARQLVRRLADFAAQDGGYEAVYLHTDPSVPGAEPFWRSLGEVVCDERQETGQSVVHFEIAVTMANGVGRRAGTSRADARAGVPATTP